MTTIGTRPLLLACLLAALAGCSGGEPEVASATATPRADSAAAPSERLGPGVTVDTQKIEDATVAEMYMTEDSAGGR